MSAFSDGCKTAATSKMELVVRMVINVWQPWTIVIMTSPYMLQQ